MNVTPRDAFSSNDSCTIAVFDSGLGGLSIAQGIRRRLPNAELIYLADTARLPYGGESPETISRYAGECARFLKQFSPDLCVVACNTVSSVALRVVEEELQVPVLGTIEATVTRVARAAPNAERIVVLSTRATALRGAYRDELCRHYRRARRGGSQDSSQTAPVVDLIPCPLFVPLIEEGIVEGGVLDSIVELYLKELEQHPPDVVVLGCTHYTFIAHAIARYLPSTVKILDSVDAVGDVAAEVVQFVGPLTPEKPSVAMSGAARYFVTDGVNRFISLANLFLGPGTVSDVQLVSLLARAPEQQAQG